jgi:single-strand DNA-binding protein
MGRLGGDPEMKYTSTGQGVVTFSLATSKKWKDKISGNAMEKTQWHRVQAWGKTGELCHQYLKKGHLVYLEGEIEYTQSEKDGVKKYFTAVIAHQIQFLTPKDEKVPNSPNATTATQAEAEWEDNSQFGGSNYAGNGQNSPNKTQSTHAPDNLPF